MIAPRVRGALLLVVTLALVACANNSEPSQPTLTPSAVAIVSGNGQVGLVGQTLSVPLVVRVTANGAPVKGAAVTFAVTAGAATVSPTSVTTDSAGQAKSLVTLGSSPGNVTITATVSGTSLIASFVVTAGSSTVTRACQTSGATTPAAGAVLPGVGGTGICLGGGTSGAEYALVVFNGTPDTLTGTQSAVSVTGFGATAVTTPSNVPGFDVAPGPALSSGQPNTLQAAFDAHLREIARRELAPLVPAAIASWRQSASRNTIPANPTVGTLVTLNANGLQACSAIKSRVSRIAAVSNSAIVVADTMNPAGGFTDAEYLSFAMMFDTLINPLDTAAFGRPSDIDGNGKVVIFFTKEVNLLTPRASGGVIGGFFFERDLFPLPPGNATFQGCAGSNSAEMFYVLVPDPTGTFNNVRSKADVLRVTPGTLIHEYQHLINAGRRMYVNPGFVDFEEVWLNEGLSHSAEELLYYKVAGLVPRQNIGIAQFNSQAAVDAFNNNQADNVNRYEVFLGKPSQTSVYGNNDSLETRGATWNLLRYLADHRGSSDGDVWSQLVNTQTTGLANLAHVFGAGYLTQIRDWATSVFSDDVAGVADVRFLQPSWNLRNIFPQLGSSGGPKLGKYPLTVVPLSDASPANLLIYSGGAAYLRFSVPAGSQASIDWSAAGLPVSGLMQFTVVRSK